MSKELLPLPEPEQWFIDVTTDGHSTGRYEVCAEEFRSSDGVVPLFTAEQMREYALANLKAEATAELVEALRRAEYCIRFYEQGGSSYRKEAVDTLQVIAESLAANAALSTQQNAAPVEPQPDVHELVAMLRKMRDEFGGLPRSLGYEFTHLPELDKMLARYEASRAQNAAPVAQPSIRVPEAMEPPIDTLDPNEDALAERYVAGWNDCRKAMLSAAPVGKEVGK